VRLHFYYLIHCALYFSTFKILTTNQLYFQKKMGVSLEDIKKLRTMTGAGLGDCKKALAESNGNIEEAIEIIRKKGQAVAAKRSDREAAEGAVLVKCENGFAAIIALKCETDFVAKNADFVKLAQDILDLAVANKCKSLEEVNALTLGGHTVAEAVTDRSGITGEKMELDGYNFIEGDNVAVYDHMGRHMLCTMVQTNKPAEEQAHNVAMQVAAMNPVALDEASVPQEVKDEELKVAIEKTKEEQVKKAVEAAIKKAGYNAYIAESEEHLEEGIRKGNITEEDAAAIRELKAKTAEEKSANLPEQMVQNIANGRMKKFYKESCLLNQEYIQDSKQTVAEYLKSTDKDLTVTAFKRFTLRAE
jgi:elongation factor Ts